MRILLVSRGFPPLGRWGTEFYTHQLALGLTQHGHEVAVLHAVRDGSQPRGTVVEEGHAGVRVFVVHNRPDPRKPLSDSYRNERIEAAFDGLLASWRPDVAHFNYLLWGLSARLPSVARSRGVGTLLTLTDLGLLCHRGQMFDWRLRDCGGPPAASVCARCIREASPFDAGSVAVALRRGAARTLALVGGLGRVVTTPDVERRRTEIAAALEGVDRFVAPTHALAEVFRRAGVLRERLVELVYSFDERPFLAARAAPASSTIRIGFLGQYAPHKGPHVLLEAARLMQQRLPESVEPWEVLLQGDSSGDRHPRYVEQAFSNPPARVRIGGSIDPSTVGAWLADVHAMVVPSLWMENAPFAALQARAAGVPVIASDVPGLAEVVEAPRFGRLFAAGDAAALADALRDVVLAPSHRTLAPGLPLDFESHLTRLEELYDGTRARSR